MPQTSKRHRTFGKIEQLPDDYVVFYINLRTKFLASYDDFIDHEGYRYTE